MTDDEAIERRLSAVERAVTGAGGADSDGTVDDRAPGRLDDIESRVEDIEETVADLEAATRALRGYVGNVRSVNRDVERRAESALAAVDRLESRLDGEADEWGPGRHHSGQDGEDGSPPGAANWRRHESPRSDRANGDGTPPTSGREMAVPGAEHHRPDRGRSDRSTPTGDGDTNREDAGLFDRVRDAL